MTARSLGPILLAAIAMAGTRPARADEPPAGATYDCGIMALYLLLNLEGHPADLKSLEANLSAPDPRGYSLKELRDAAAALDLPLQGVKLSRDAPAPRTPALAYVRIGAHGHYVVVRPVGHTGSLVQVIDSNRDAEVIDARTFFQSSRWTGLVLVPRQGTWGLWLVILGGVGVGGLGAALLLRRKTARSQTDAEFRERSGQHARIARPGDV